MKQEHSGREAQESHGFSRGEEVKDMVNHPPHYNTNSSGLQVWDVTRYLPFGLGNAFKYISRANHKQRFVEDLKKAIWYLESSVQDAYLWDYPIYPEYKENIRIFIQHEPDAKLKTTMGYFKILVESRETLMVELIVQTLEGMVRERTKAQETQVPQQ